MRCLKVTGARGHAWVPPRCPHVTTLPTGSCEQRRCPGTARPVRLCPPRSRYPSLPLPSTQPPSASCGLGPHAGPEPLRWLFANTRRRLYTGVSVRPRVSLHRQHGAHLPQGALSPGVVRDDCRKASSCFLFIFCHRSYVNLSPLPIPGGTLTHMLARPQLHENAAVGCYPYPQTRSLGESFALGFVCLLPLKYL